MADYTNYTNKEMQAVAIAQQIKTIRSLSSAQVCR